MRIRRVWAGVDKVLTYSNGGFRDASIDQVLSKTGKLVSNGEQCFILDIRDNGEV